MVVSVAYKILLDISWGKLFEKASQPRWWSLIPFRNIYKTFALIKRGGLFIGTLVLSAVLPFVVIYEEFYLIERLFVLEMHKKRLGKRSLKSEKRIISDIQKP